MAWATVPRKRGATRTASSAASAATSAALELRGFAELRSAEGKDEDPRQPRRSAHAARDGRRARSSDRQDRLPFQDRSEAAFGYYPWVYGMASGRPTLGDPNGAAVRGRRRGLYARQRPGRQFHRRRSAIICCTTRSRSARRSSSTRSPSSRATRRSGSSFPADRSASCSAPNIGRTTSSTTRTSRSSSATPSTTPSRPSRRRSRR